jgi:Putative metallopeptidase
VPDERFSINSIGAIVGVAFILSNLADAQSQTTAKQSDQSNRVSVAYVATEDLVLERFYRLLKERRAMEKIQEMLTPFHLPEELTIKTAECGVVNSWYKRENFKPIVTICYDLRHILESLPSKATAAAVTPADATAGQFFHEVGHAIFGIFDVPIFGHPGDAADNFAAYILLQFGKEQARLDWRRRVGLEGVLGRYKRDPVVRKRISAFADTHGPPEERFYNLLCLAYGADPVLFADADDYLPPTRLPSCAFEYRTLVKCVS